MTIEWWLLATEDNDAPAPDCSHGLAWISGNIVVDRDRFSLGRKFGASLANGRLVFGVSGATDGDAVTLCGDEDLRDGQWHHIAVQRRRSDGWVWLYVDGSLVDGADGPDGDVSYPDGVASGSGCGGCTEKDPFLVIGAEKHDADPTAYPPFHGWVDEVRLSTVLRYSAGGFDPPTGGFVPDADTASLYHFDEGSGTVAADAAGDADGVLRVGGDPPGPEWSDLTPFGGGEDDDRFSDDDGSVFEGDVEWLASVGVTAGCNPPVNDRFCPDDAVTRGQMAAFLRRALG
jgi:hypothetical protein